MSGLTLSPRRVGLLMRHDLASQKKSLITGIATISGITLAAFLITSATGGPRVVMTNLFANILVIGGFIASSVTFTEMHEQRTGMHYLMLPGSVLEKYAAKLLLTSLGWTAAVTVVTAVVTALGAGIASIFFAENPGIIVPSDRAQWTTIASYLVSQSVFLFGSIYFRKTAFLKTALSALVAVFTFAVVWILAIRVFYASAFTEHFGGPGFQSVRLTAQGESFLSGLEVVGKTLAWAVVPVFFWIAGVLRLRETEV